MHHAIVDLDLDDAIICLSRALLYLPQAAWQGPQPLISLWTTNGQPCHHSVSFTCGQSGEQGKVPTYCFPATCKPKSVSRRLAVESITGNKRLKRDECPSCNRLVFSTPARPPRRPLGSPTVRRASEEKQSVPCTSAIVPPTAAWNTVVSAVRIKVVQPGNK